MVFKERVMETANLNISLPLNFKQVFELVKQLPDSEKLKLRDLLSKETTHMSENDVVLTHFASESVLSKDWLLPEEDEAWKDL